MRERLEIALPPLAVILVLLGAWELYVQAAGVSAFVLPAPHAIATELWNNAGLISTNLKTTAEEVALGLALALVVGFALAVTIHLSPLVRRCIYPLAVGSQAIPIPVIAVQLVFWLGFGVAPKLIVIVLICFFPVVVSTVDGLAAVDTDQLKLLRTFDASRWQLFRFAELPAAAPAALSGTRIAVAVGVIAAFIAEISTAGTSSGLGYEILTDIHNLKAPRADAAAFVLFAFAIVCFHTLGLVERRLAPRSHRHTGDNR
jgi:NitT/TauT family transport system permease protein/putative hydroxymethylpyrimidine transport system permease protein